jgi:hypothetical protein
MWNADFCRDRERSNQLDYVHKNAVSILAALTRLCRSTCSVSSKTALTIPTGFSGQTLKSRWGHRASTRKTLPVHQKFNPLSLQTLQAYSNSNNLTGR